MRRLPTSSPVLTTAALLLATLLVAADCTAQDRRGRGRRDRQESQSEGTLEHVTWQEGSFKSDALKGKIEYGYFAPKDIKPDERLPLVLWLHGMRKNHTEFNRRGGAKVLDRLMGSGAIPRMIFVTANGKRSFYTNGYQDGQWEDMVRKDLVAEAVKNLQASKKPQERAIMGISMGGMGALKIAMKYPGEFTAVATHSAAVFPEDPAELSGRMQQAVKWLGLDEVYGDPINPEVWAAENPLNLARKLDPEKVGTLGIYFDAGTRDRYRFHLSNLLLSKALKESKVPHTCQIRDGHGHSWGSGFQMSSLEESLRFVGARLTADAAAEAGRKGLSGLLGGDDGEKAGDEGEQPSSRPTSRPGPQPTSRPGGGK